MNAAATLFSLAPILVLVVALVVLRLPAWKAALAAFDHLIRSSVPAARAGAVAEAA